MRCNILLSPTYLPLATDFYEQHTAAFYGLMFVHVYQSELTELHVRMQHILMSLDCTCQSNRNPRMRQRTNIVNTIHPESGVHACV